MSVDEAKTQYLAWTSKFLDSAYAKAKRSGDLWYYVQVTELQKRGHPHSHILTTFAPSDIREGFREDWRRNNNGRLVKNSVVSLRSDWILSAVERSGLGNQYDISRVKTVEAASRYVAKYMFKDSQFGTHFPKGWKRVRYSQTWPKLPDKKTDAFVLLSSDDWRHLATLAVVVDAIGRDAADQAEYFLRGSDVVIHEREERRENASRDNKI